MGVMEHWNWAPSLESSKSRLDMGLGTLLWVALLEWGGRQMTPELPSHPVIL